MTTYFESVNQNNIVQINDSFYNHAGITKGSVATVFTGAGLSLGAFATVSYTSPTGTVPIIAFRCKTRVCAITNTAVSGNTWSWTFCTTEVNAGTPVQPVGTVEYWIFDAPPASNSTLGLQIFKGNGQLLYDSLFPYMEIVDIFSWSSSYYDGSGQLACIQSNPVLNTGFDGPASGRYTNYVDVLGCFLNQGIQASVHWMYNANSYYSSLPIGYISNNDPMWLLVDISKV